MHFFPWKTIHCNKHQGNLYCYFIKLLLCHKLKPAEFSFPKAGPTNVHKLHTVPWRLAKALTVNARLHYHRQDQ